MDTQMNKEQDIKTVMDFLLNCKQEEAIKLISQIASERPELRETLELQLKNLK